MDRTPKKSKCLPESACKSHLVKRIKFTETYKNYYKSMTPNDYSLYLSSSLEEVKLHHKAKQNRETRSNFDILLSIIAENEKGDFTKGKEKLYEMPMLAQSELLIVYPSQENKQTSEDSIQKTEKKAYHTCNCIKLSSKHKEEILEARAAAKASVRLNKEGETISTENRCLVNKEVQTDGHVVSTIKDTESKSFSKSSRFVKLTLEVAALSSIIAEKDKLVQESGLKNLTFIAHEKATIENIKREKEQLELTYQAELREKEDALQQTKTTIEEKSTEIKLLRERLMANENERIFMNEQLQELKGTMRVFCRLKPLPLDSKSIFEIPSQGKAIRFINLLNPGSKPKRYFFDRIFTDNDSQSDIFAEIRPFIQSAYDGNFVTIFAYGQTGSGKTFTLEGTEQLPGVLRSSLELLIDLKKTDEKLSNGVQILMSCLEIYNERLIDLLDDGFDANGDMKINLINGTVVIPGLKESSLSAYSDIKILCAKAANNRNVEKTAFNERSSRSHCLYRIRIIQNKNDQRSQTGILNIIDLAGSERSSMGLDSGLNPDKIKKIQKEAAFINKSLTTLGRVMRMLKDQKSTGAAINLPVRETKLTRVLQDCLGESYQTLLFINVRQEDGNYAQTKESLNFGTFSV